MAKTTKKKLGQIYTPSNIVRMMLDYAGYTSPNIRRKHVIDNSCGNGRFLVEVVRRYLSTCSAGEINMFPFDVIKELETYVHGIEIDEKIANDCISNLNEVAQAFGLYGDIHWDIKVANALAVHDYDGSMDFIFGNPPYIRTRNTDDLTYRQYSFAEKGMSDIYLAFYQHGLEMRSESGVLCYVAPSAWTNNASGLEMRNFVKKNRELACVIDFEDTQIFEGASAYVMVTLFDKHPHAFVRYDVYDEGLDKFCPVSCVQYDEMFIDNKIYFGRESELDFISQIYKTEAKTVSVKNGYATLADSFFIDDLPELSKYTMPIVKASTGERKMCLFPYSETLLPVSLEIIKDSAEDVYDYIIGHEEDLRNRAYEKKGSGGMWHIFGRSQAVGDTMKHKVSVNSLIRSEADIKLVDVGTKEGVYGGLYILTDKSSAEISEVLRTPDFAAYVRSLRKYKSGGYYTFSAKDLERYLNCKLCA